MRKEVQAAAFGIILGLCYFLFLKSQRRNRDRYGRSKYAPAIQVLPEIKSNEQALTFLRSQTISPIEIHFRITVYRPIGGYSTDELVQGQGFGYFEKELNQLKLLYSWKDAGAMLEQWPVASSKLTVMFNRGNEQINRFTVTSWPKYQPLSIEPTSPESCDQLKELLLNLPFKRITSRHELV